MSDSAITETASGPETSATTALVGLSKDSRPVKRPRALVSPEARQLLSSHWYVHYKALVEWPLALLLSLLALPIVFLCALLVKLTSRGPAFYSQTRLGKEGRPFQILKIRTMFHECERGSGAVWSRPGDSRITPIGWWLRKLHLDELPQLWNVLRGDMALVGPRPERPEFVPSLEQAIPHYCDRLVVKPGVTGLAQVQLPADTDLNSVRRKLTYDLYYISQLNFWLDLRLIVCTAFHLLGLPYGAVAWLFGLPRQQTTTNTTR